MKKVLQQLLILLMCYAVFLIWPAPANSFFPILVYFMVAVTILWLPVKHYSKYKRGGSKKAQAWAAFGWDFLKILLVILLASFLAKNAAVYVSGFAESHWHGVGTFAGFISLLILSILVANGVKWGMEKLGKFLRLVD